MHAFLSPQLIMPILNLGIKVLGLYLDTIPQLETMHLNYKECIQWEVNSADSGPGTSSPLKYEIPHLVEILKWWILAWQIIDSFPFFSLNNRAMYLCYGKILPVQYKMKKENSKLITYYDFSTTINLLTFLFLNYCCVVYLMRTLL